MYNRNYQPKGILTQEGWMKMLRLAATLGGALAMYASAQFSVQGFSIENPDLRWIGWGLAILIIIVEFTWRKPGMEDNLTMSIVGITAYAYGIITNIAGILFAMGIYKDVTSDVFSLVIAIITGVFLEVMPEPLFSWGVTGQSMADFFEDTRSFVNGTNKVIPDPKQKNYSRTIDLDPEVEKRRQEFHNNRRKGNNGQKEETLPLAVGGSFPERELREFIERNNQSKDLRRPILRQNSNRKK